MKIRLFLLLSALFLLAGLFTPVGVYANDAPAVDGTLAVETETADIVNATCADGETAMAVAVDEEAPSTEGEGVGTTDDCGAGDDGDPAFVSWNS